MKKSKAVINNLLMLSSVLIISTNISFGQVCNHAELASKIDSYINPLVDSKEFSGSILIAKGDTILFSKGYGLANQEFGVQNTPNTVFKIGSMTKQFTATAIMQLVEKNKISVESKLSDFISDDPNGNQISIHQLLTHTSGIQNFTKLPDYTKTMSLSTTLLELIDRIKYLPLEFEPGSKFKYNDSGYLLLTYIIEQVSGMSYKEYLEKNIFQPLKMKNSGCEYHNEIIKNQASGYIVDKKTNEFKNADYLDMSIPQGAGCLHSSILDLYKWDRSFYKNEILSKESKEKMFTFNMADYGYGWGKEIRKGGRISIGHNGIINGYSSIIHRFINDDVVIIVLTNIENFKVNEVFDKIPALYFNEEEML